MFVFVFGKKATSKNDKCVDKCAVFLLKISLYSKETFMESGKSLIETSCGFVEIIWSMTGTKWSGLY